MESLCRAGCLEYWFVKVWSAAMDMLVSSALEADSSLPSFFEMFMTQQVEESIKPAARHAHRCADELGLQGAAVCCCVLCVKS